MKRKKVTLQRISGALCRALDKAEHLLENSDLPPDMVLRACSTIATVAGAAVKCHEATVTEEKAASGTDDDREAVARAFVRVMVESTGQSILIPPQ